MGDPTGIGPEIIIGALLQPEIYSICRPTVFGSKAVIRKAIALCQSERAQKDRMQLTDANDSPDLSLEASPELLICRDVCSAEASNAPAGRVDPRGGQAAYDSLVAATQACLSGGSDAIVTAPLNKAALHAAGHHWPGHTELLAELCEVQQYAMMLYLPPSSDPTARHRGPAGLGVIHTTLHTALRNVFAELTTDAIFDKIELAQLSFERLRTAYGLPPYPALAVAALNPHGGEGGLFGDEESTTIGPAVERAKAMGWNVTGPLPVDTLMPRAVAGDFDAVVAMYHDQGHIALKLLDMFDAVNITLGLPIIRTSVAHGTAFELAWQGTAKHSGMTQAIAAAARLASLQ
jgi:4-hydroxythreonine-4-phosphate dehydrogenase